jgi:hypothetical protein
MSQINKQTLPGRYCQRAATPQCEVKRPEISGHSSDGMAVPLSGYSASNFARAAQKGRLFFLDLLWRFAPNGIPMVLRCRAHMQDCLTVLVAVVAVSAFPGYARASIHRIDTGGFVGQYTSITIGSDGLGLISYHDLTNGELNVAHCSNVACSTAETAVLDPRPGEVVGWWTSITIGSDGFGLISYYNLPSGDLNVIHCSSPKCLTP